MEKLSVVTFKLMFYICSQKLLYMYISIFFNKINNREGYLIHEGVKKITEKKLVILSSFGDTEN